MAGLLENQDGHSHSLLFTIPKRHVRCAAPSHDGEFACTSVSRPCWCNAMRFLASTLRHKRSLCPDVAVHRSQDAPVCPTGRRPTVTQTIDNFSGLLVLSANASCMAAARLPLNYAAPLHTTVTRAASLASTWTPPCFLLHAPLVWQCLARELTPLAWTGAFLVSSAGLQ